MTQNPTPDPLPSPTADPLAGLSPVELFRAAGEPAPPHGSAPDDGEIADAFPKLEILGLIGQDGRVKIVDFGIARIVGDPARDFTLTLTGAALGSAPYMAPEQHERPHEVDHRADIHSLGVVFYEMLTGELPLGRFPNPIERAAVHARIAAIVLQTLEKERELRQQTAAEVKTDIQRAARGGHRSILRQAVTPELARKLDLRDEWDLFSQSDVAVRLTPGNFEILDDSSRAVRNPNGVGESFTRVNGRWLMDTPAYGRWEATDPPATASNDLKPEATKEDPVETIPSDNR